MLTRNLLLLTLLITIGGKLCCAQSIIIDSCGVDSLPYLNKYEVHFVDSALFAPIKLRKGKMMDIKHGFDFNSKKILFYSGDRFLNKIEFFRKIKEYVGAGRCVSVLNEEEKKASGGYDAIIVINSPHLDLSNMELINITNTGKKESFHK